MSPGPAIRGILFDKDGTLLAFDDVWPPAYRALADELARAAGAPDLASRLLRIGGYDAAGRLDPASPLACGTNDEIAALWGAEPALAGVTDIAARIERVFADHARRAPAVVADLPALLARLRGRGLALGIATNDTAAAARDWVETAALGTLFDFVAGYDSGHGAKPDPGMVRAFCRATGLATAEVALVGDSVQDMATARLAGCGLAVAVLTGVTARARLAASADCVIASIAEIEDALSGVATSRRE